MKTRIYLVDDHALLRCGLAALIAEQPDLEVCGQSEHAADAVEEVRRLRPEGVIMDLSPGNGGDLALLRGLREADAELPILVFSMHDESLHALRALRAGARGYVMKQEAGDRVIEALRRVVRGQYYVSPRIAGQMLGARFEKCAPQGDLFMAGLSERQRDIAGLIGRGLPTREIATRLSLSVKTIETHRAHIKDKLNLPDATRLVQFCVRCVQGQPALGT